MADDILLGKVHRLSDLELAVLLCLICREHCIISTESHAVDQLVQELQLATTRTFSLKPVVVDCGPLTTLDDFAAGIQLSSSPSAPRPSSPYCRPQSHLHHNPQASLGHASFHSAHTGRIPSLTPAHTGGTATRTSAGSQVLSSSPQWPQTSLPGSGEIAHVVLAKNLDLAPKAVQIQALELLRTKRLFTRTSVLVAPKQFLLIAVLSAPSGGQAHLTPHLNDFFYVAHWHDPEDGFANVEEAEEEEEATWKGKGSALSGYAKSYEESDAETSSTTSVVKTYNTKRGSLSSSTSPSFSESDLSTLAKLSQEVSVDIEVIRYQMNIVSFLRMHRAVAGGISPTATKHFDQLIRCLAPLHGLDFVTPSLVALAAKKIYLHRIQIVAPEKERSMQWGSELEAVAALLEGIGPEDVIEDVLGMVSAPL